MGFTEQLCNDIAAGILAPAGVGVFRATGSYQAGEVGIVMSVVPDLPLSVITLSPYPLGDDSRYADSLQGLQVRCRHAAVNDPRPVQDLDDSVFDALAGQHDLELVGGVHIGTVRRTSGSPLGQDDNLRWETSSNYQMTLYRPTPHRL